MSIYINSKKLNILYDNIKNFVKALKKLEDAYLNDDKLYINKYTCITERWATVSLTQLECWTTKNNISEYKVKINDILSRDLKDLHEDLKSFIKKQSHVNNTMYYTYKFLSLTDILNRNNFMIKYLNIFGNERYIHEDVVNILKVSKERYINEQVTLNSENFNVKYLYKEVNLKQFNRIKELMEVDFIGCDSYGYETYHILINFDINYSDILDVICIKKPNKFIL